MNLIRTDREMEMFGAVSEDVSDLKYQKEVVAILEHLRIPGKLVDLINQNLSRKISLEALKHYLMKKNLITKDGTYVASDQSSENDNSFASPTGSPSIPDMEQSLRMSSGHLLLSRKQSKKLSSQSIS